MSAFGGISLKLFLHKIRLFDHEDSVLKWQKSGLHNIMWKISNGNILADISYNYAPAAAFYDDDDVRDDDCFEDEV